MNVRRPQAVQTRTNKHIIITAVAREQQKISVDFARRLGLFHPRVFEVLRDYHLLIHHILRSAYPSPDVRSVMGAFLFIVTSPRRE
jgi:hypothetical protein